MGETFGTDPAELPAEHPLARVLAGQAADFALLHRPQSAGPDVVEVLVGDVSRLWRLADLPLASGPTAVPARPRHDVLAMLPYRQITERGFACRDDGEPILAMTVTAQDTVTLDDALDLLPDRSLTLTDQGFDIDDPSYAELVRRIIADEIGNGAGSNFVIKRSFTARIADYSPAAALALFRNLLDSELGAYWTFVARLGDRTFVGATPERHASLTRGTAVMNPISGTYRYPAAGPSLAGVLDFLLDRKETEELYMVVDEELKMMARVCASGGRVVGPYLKEMARLAHTEYLIEGPSTLDVREVLRETMFAPTVTGSPLENACRVLARHEPVGRGYYSGVIALVGRDTHGQRTLDSSILIRTADIADDGLLRLGVGATLVRHSDPDAEVAETRAKAAGLLAAAGVPDGRDSSPVTASTGSLGREITRVTRGAVIPLGTMSRHVAVRDALLRRNGPLARFWLDDEPPEHWLQPWLAGRRVLVVDAEDRFTAMLLHQLRALGLDVDIALHSEVAAEPGMVDEVDLVLTGPGPGDPTDGADPRIALHRQVTEWALAGGKPLLAVCLGHQVLATTLGLPIVRKDPPSQGLQREINLFGRVEKVGFYNTFAATAPSDRVRRLGRSVWVSRDARTGEVHALRGHGFASMQFHPESVLTRNGPRILSGAVGWALGVRGLMPWVPTQQPSGTVRDGVGS